LTGLYSGDDFRSNDAPFRWLRLLSGPLLWLRPGSRGRKTRPTAKTRFRTLIDERYSAIDAADTELAHGSGLTRLRLRSSSLGEERGGKNSRAMLCEADGSDVQQAATRKLAAEPTIHILGWAWRSPRTFVATLRSKRSAVPTMGRDARYSSPQSAGQGLAAGHTFTTRTGDATARRAGTSDPN